MYRKESVVPLLYIEIYRLLMIAVQCTVREMIVRDRDGRLECSTREIKMFRIAVHK